MAVIPGVSDGELIRTTWGDAVADELNNNTVKKTGDFMTGPLRIGSSDNSPYLAFRTAVGASLGYIQMRYGPGQMIIDPESTHSLLLYSGGSEQMRLTPGARVLFGKTAEGIHLTGCMVAGFGNMHTTTNIVSTNLTHNKISVAFVDGQAYEAYLANGTTIGSITVASASSVAFNTTSDEDLKENIVEVDDELALLWMREIQPFFFNYIGVPDVRHVGYIAQRLAAAWPNSVAVGIVKPGHGDVNQRTWDAEGNETTPPEVWEPWQIDYSKFTPLLHSALQALDRQNATQAARIDDLEVRIAALEAAA